MNTNEINLKLRKYKTFLGTFPSDRIPESTKRPVCFVLNTDPSSEPGEHWVAVYLKKNGTGEYFDSFGLPPLCNNIKKYLNKSCPLGYKYSTITLQGVFSDTCGNYCVMYLDFRNKGYKYNQIISMFSENCFFNDKLVKVYSEKL